MKAKELMIGDWLNVTDRAFAKVNKIAPEDGGIELYNSDSGLYYYEDEGDVFKPIPLTPEILEANGFRNEDDIWFSKDYDYGIDNQNGLMEFFKYDGEFVEAKIPRCFYTHQFQHALRLCGLNEMADKFKLTKKGDNDNE